jgi:hypothetical protein
MSKAAFDEPHASCCSDGAQEAEMWKTMVEPDSEFFLNGVSYSFFWIWDPCHAWSLICESFSSAAWEAGSGDSQHLHHTQAAYKYYSAWAVAAAEHKLLAQRVQGFITELEPDADVDALSLRPENFRKQRWQTLARAALRMLTLLGLPQGDDVQHDEYVRAATMGPR